jgi:uncharacterized tellurite resistance protein B-like protein
MSDKFPIEMANDLIAKKREKLLKDMSAIALLDRQLTELEGELNRSYG